MGTNRDFKAARAPGPFVLCSCLILFLVITLVDPVRSQSFVVTVSPDNIVQVQERFTSQGFTVKQLDVKRGFLVVEPPGSLSASPPIPSPSPAGSEVTEQQSTVTAASPVGSSTLGRDRSGNLVLSAGGEESFLSGPRVTASQTPQVPPKYAGSTPAQQHDSANAAVAQLLQAAGGEQVLSVQRVPTVRLLHRNMQRRTLHQVRQAAAGSCPLQPTLPSAERGLQFGNITDVIPYGIAMVEADRREIIDISRQHRSKVLYCVIDTGIDKNNGEFDPASTSGCVPGLTRPDGSEYKCDYNWYEQETEFEDSHGTHTSGIIAARRNGRGIAGVSAEGAQLYHYNAFGRKDTFEFIDAIKAWDDCIAELDYRKAATNTPDMKLVISMAWSSSDSFDIIDQTLSDIYRNRSDVLLVAAAGNSGGPPTASPGDEGFNAPQFPAASPEVVAVAAVDAYARRSTYSQFNDDIEWAAPGDDIMSTVPTWIASELITDASINMVPPNTPPSDMSDVLFNPRIQIMGSSGLGNVTGGMVDCGLGADVCKNATGKICLLQRGGGLLFCNKVQNCLAGNGTGAVVYGREDQPECEQVTAVTLLSAACQPPVGDWPVVVTASRKQGMFLKQAITSNPDIQFTISSGKGDYSLMLMSGTSMATPMAAGVAGVLWSANTNCSADQIRAAVSATAQDRGRAGRDPQYGFGIVKALAAHKYLLENPCNTTDCVGTWSNWSACNSTTGLQSSTYTITQAATGSNGKRCEARDGAVRTRICTAGPSAVNDEFIVPMNTWKGLNLVQNDLGSVVAVRLPSARSTNGGQLKLEFSPERSSSGTKMPSDSQVAYLSRPGFMGQDTFTYIITDTLGRTSTGNVTVNVTAGSCDTHSCLTGICSAGSCTCQAGSGTFNTWIVNPETSQRDTVPTVPACRFRAFTPVAPFSLNNIRAVRQTAVSVDFIISPNRPPRCFPRMRNPIASAAFVRLPDRQAATVCPSNGTLLPSSTQTPGWSGCVNGMYSYTVKMPATPGCYRMALRMFDTTVRMAFVGVVDSGTRKRTNASSSVLSDLGR